MESSIEDMRSAFRYFNEHLFDGRLPSGTRLSLDNLNGAVACCSKTGFSFHIRFSRKHFGDDLAEDLSTLVHEMAHADVWRDTKGGHDAPWRAWMTALGFETDEQGRETPIAGGKFARARDAWMEGRKNQGVGARAGARPSSPSFSAAANAQALLLTLVIGGVVLIAMIIATTSGGGRRHYSRDYDRDEYSYGSRSYSRRDYWRDYDEDDRW